MQAHHSRSTGRCHAPRATMALLSSAPNADHERPVQMTMIDISPETHAAYLTAMVRYPGD